MRAFNDMFTTAYVELNARIVEMVMPPGVTHAYINVWKSWNAQGKRTGVFFCVCKHPRDVPDAAERIKIWRKKEAHQRSLSGGGESDRVVDGEHPDEPETPVDRTEERRLAEARGFDMGWKTLLGRRQENKLKRKTLVCPNENEYERIRQLCDRQNLVEMPDGSIRVPGDLPQA